VIHGGLLQGTSRIVPWLKWTHRFAQQMPNLRQVVLATSPRPSLKHLCHVLASHPHVDSLCLENQGCLLLNRYGPKQLKRQLIPIFKGPGHAPLRKWLYKGDKGPLGQWDEKRYSGQELVTLLCACSQRSLQEFIWTGGRWSTNYRFDMETVLSLVQLPDLHTFDATGFGFDDEIDTLPLAKALVQRAASVPWQWFGIRWSLNEAAIAEFTLVQHAHLHSLFLVVPRATPEAVLLTIFRACPSLVRLGLEGSDQLSDRGLEQVARHYLPRIQQLLLDVAYEHSPSAKLDILTDTIAPRLTRLVLDQCLQVSLDQVVRFLQTAVQLQCLSHINVMQNENDIAVKFYGNRSVVVWNRQVWNAIKATPFGLLCRPEFQDGK